MEKEIIVVLGPTASGKTALAVALAEKLGGEIISADSRQVYRGMDIGTGKDLAEYGEIPCHLIDIAEAGEQYNLARYQHDFQGALEKTGRNRAIVCGGSGLYIQGVVQGFSNTFVPENEGVRRDLEALSDEELDRRTGKNINTRKRKIRALEIAAFQKEHAPLPQRDQHNFLIFGLDPPVELRRKQISTRLKGRINQGMMAEVETLMASGISPEMLEYYGLEYKYISAFLLGFLRYDEMYTRLETEIHRYAKRQMTFFRSMEKKGIAIDWIPFELALHDKVAYITQRLSPC